MNETFENLKNELRVFLRQQQNKDPLVASMDKLIDQHQLRRIINELKKNFLKEPTFIDEYMMHCAYKAVDPQLRSQKDLDNWFNHVQKFVKKCPSNLDQEKRLIDVVSYLPEISKNTDKILKCAKEALKIMPIEAAEYPNCKTLVQKIALKDFYNQFSQAQKFDEPQKKVNAYKKALNRTLDVLPSMRYKCFYDCIRAMEPLYNQTESGQYELWNLKKTYSNRIFKSLPWDMQQNIRNRRNNAEWTYR